MSTKVKFVVIFLIVVMSACSNQVTNTSTEHTATASPFAIPATSTQNPTPSPEIKPTTSPTYIMTHQPTLISTPYLGRGWFLITDLEPNESVSLGVTKSFIGIKIPPLPDNAIQEFVYLYPDGGELPSSTIYHQIFVIRQGNARMIWLGIPFAETISQREGRIYDSIPMPPTKTDDVLIAFTCSRNNESDDTLVVIASRPDGEEPATDIHYAWRIDPASTTLQPVNFRNIVCWSY